MGRSKKAASEYHQAQEIMSYKIVIEKAAKKYLQKQSSITILRIIKAIEQIAADPSIGELFHSHNAQYKYRVGSYRIQLLL